MKRNRLKCLCCGVLIAGVVCATCLETYKVSTGFSSILPPHVLQEVSPGFEVPAATAMASGVAVRPS